MHHTFQNPANAELVREHNVVAAALSLALPGLGHVYKGRYGSGLAILLLGAPIAIWVGVLLSLATLGLGLVIPVFYWAMTAICAYYTEDHRARHPFNLP
jgi:hypothetical protein